MNDILPSVGACVLVNLCVTTPSCLLIFLIKYIKLFSNKTKLKQFVYLKLFRLIIIRYGCCPQGTKTFHSPAGDVFPATVRPATNLSFLRCRLLHCKVIHTQDFQSWQPAKQTLTIVDKKPDKTVLWIWEKQKYPLVTNPTQLL